MRPPGTVARFELALIGHFREAVPDPSERWDAKRRFREIERRLARLRWVEMEQEKEFGGFRDLFNKARGRRRVTGQGDVREDGGGAGPFGALGRQAPVP